MLRSSSKCEVRGRTDHEGSQRRRLIARYVCFSTYRLAHSAGHQADKGKAKAKASSGTRTRGKASTRLTDSEKDELEESADEGDDQYEAGEEEDADGSDGKERESGEEGDDGESGEGEEEGGRGEEGAHEEGSEDDNIVVSAAFMCSQRIDKYCTITRLRRNQSLLAKLSPRSLSPAGSTSPQEESRWATCR